MSDPMRDRIEETINAYSDPYTESSLKSAGALKSLEIDEGKVEAEIVLGFPAAGYRESLIADLEERIFAVDGVKEAKVRVDWKVASHAVQQGLEALKNVRNIIAVASGKGGVGKSTVAANLALALSAEGATTGVLDADIYGPSQPRMLGAQGKPDSKDGKSLEPMTSYRIQSMSIGYLIEEDTPMIWRGPMVTQALEQLLRDTNWRELDYLVVDLPPGTGDIQLTLAQRIPVSGAIIVTTPQDIALLDARKGLAMFEKVKVPVLGIVENMSIHICSQCGHEDHIFGAGGGERIASEYGVTLLGDLPLDRRIREDVDGGQPTVARDPDSPTAKKYREIARKVAARLSLRARDYSQAFPRIVIQ
ncbi:MAG: iron-sulfur cluster carrier protein ApbC [Ectothiorhodospiraceae bacterium AqS1]|nr:iron-sulfur cluster carrier protein ApbC [Ectothiorhodospiraceae bacterium AqS1]